MKLNVQMLYFDLIMCYKILNNIVRIDSDMFFKRSSTVCTRGNCMKLAKCHSFSARDSHFLQIAL